jgi:hypothetical protein
MLAFLMILAGFSTLSAASYEVFMVRGDIHYEGSGEQLKEGITIASGERVKFSDQKAVAVLISKDGRFTLSGANLGSKFKAGEFFTVKSATKPGNTGQEARIQPDFKSPQDLADFMSGDPFLILREAEINISREALSLPADALFVFRIKKYGEPFPLTKRLGWTKNTLTLNGADISSSGSARDLSDYKLMLWTQVGTPMKEIGAVNIVLAEELNQKFRDEIDGFTKKIRTALGNDSMDEDGLKQQILDYLIDYYGRPVKENFESWVIEFL